VYRLPRRTSEDRVFEVTLAMAEGVTKETWILKGVALLLTIE
jgi:hypothetical protein